MCQLPFMRMWVRSTSPPENRMSRCLPDDETLSTVCVVSGVSTCTRVSAGNIDSKRTTGVPAGARCTVLAARKIVSPSGMPLGAARCQRVFVFRLLQLVLAAQIQREARDRRRRTPHHEAHGGRNEAGADQVRRNRM